MKDKKEEEFTNQVEDLLRELESSGDSRDAKLAKKTRQLRSDQKKFEKSLTDLQESLDYLRICIKYQVFDLEATRRENEYLRRLLEGEFDDDELIG